MVKIGVSVGFGVVARLMLWYFSLRKAFARSWR